MLSPRGGTTAEIAGEVMSSNPPLQGRQKVTRAIKDSERRGIKQKLRFLTAAIGRSRRISAPTTP